MRIALALCALLLAVPASASTYRIDVTGNFDPFATFGGVTAIDTDGDVVPIASPGHVQASVTISPYLASFALARSGSARWDGANYSDCTGLIAQLCRGFGSFQTGTYTGSSGSGFLTLTDTSLFYADDGLYSWSASGIDYFSLGIASLKGTVASLTVTPVPLPTPILMLLSALGLLRLSGRVWSWPSWSRHFSIMRNAGAD